MTIRTTPSTVTFTKPFVLDGLEEEQPAGTYDIDVDEERLDGLSFSAYRRVQTLIHLHPKTGNPSLVQTMKIDPDDLEAALKRDRALADGGTVQDLHETAAANEAEDACREGADHEAPQRAATEEMILAPRMPWPRRANRKPKSRLSHHRDADPGQ